ncbi:MAG TPA: hypothetical protein VK509_12510, partial [Polyangiales bacterium]|nr:hypothetical protein [Polyangiales bacterium]
LALWALALPASAQRTSSLSWVRLAGAEDCIGTQALAERVEHRVGHRVFVSASQADLSLEGHVERAPEGTAFIATLVVSDRSGRELGRRVLRATGTRCSALDPALVLVIAIGLDPDAALPATRDADGLSDDTQALLAQLELPKANEEALRELAVPDPSAERPSSTELDLDRPGRPPSDRSPGSRSIPGRARDTGPAGMSVAFGITGELGVLPSAGFGGTVRITVGIAGFWPIELALSGLLPDREPLRASPAVAELALLAAGASLCTPHNGPGVLEFFACAGPRAGALYAHGDGFPQDLSTTSPWFELAAHAATRLRFGAQRSWLVQLLVGAGVPVIRDTFRYEDEEGSRRDLHRPGVLVGRIELGTGVSF